jgi:DNA-binding LacI/PurR family transcriptional regulator
VFATRLRRKRVDGVMVVALALRREERAHLQKLGVPVVVIGGDTVLPSVRIDDHEAALVAVRHLLDLGHRDIAFVGGPPTEPQAFPPPYDRVVGYRRGLIDAGIEPQPGRELPGDFTVAAGIEAGRMLLKDATPPTAVVAASDEMAMGVLCAARADGVDVPTELSVVGIDDHEMSGLWNLTTVAQPVREQGRLAARMLLDALSGIDPPAEPIVVPTSLVLRGTTAPPHRIEAGRLTVGAPA